MKKGDIILIPFPFTDLSGNKTRPALVLAVSKSDIIVSFISGNVSWPDESDLIVNPTIENGLKKESLIRISKLATLDKSLILGLLGEIDSKSKKQINQNLIKILNL